MTPEREGHHFCVGSPASVSQQENTAFKNKFQLGIVQAVCFCVIVLYADSFSATMAIELVAVLWRLRSHRDIIIIIIIIINITALFVLPVFHWEFIVYVYLCQTAYVLHGICLRVSVSRINQKFVDEFWWNYLEVCSVWLASDQQALIRCWWWCGACYIRLRDTAVLAKVCALLSASCIIFSTLTWHRYNNKPVVNHILYYSIEVRSGQMVSCWTVIQLTIKATYSLL